MSWAAELRQAFDRLEARQPSRVGFSDRAGPVGEVGREFNALAADLEHRPSEGLSRDQAHRLRNRLAGILAALQVLEASGELSAEENRAVSRVLATARQLDARLRAG